MVSHYFMELSREMSPSGNLHLSPTLPLLLVSLVFPHFSLLMRNSWWYLLHLDEEAINEVPRVVGVKCRLVGFDLLGNEVLQLLNQVINAVVSSRQVLHDAGIHIIELGGKEEKPGWFVGQTSYLRLVPESQEEGRSQFCKGGSTGRNLLTHTHGSKVCSSVAPYLCQRGAHLYKTFVDQSQQGEEGFIFIVKAAAKDDGADDVGDRAAQEEGGVEELT